jgi:peptidyl-prolyl cis-trans isomerase B (cyclophilin B)
MLKSLTLVALCCVVSVFTTSAQDKAPDTRVEPQTPQKTNRRANDELAKPAEPFDKADVETMRSQCVRLETGAGVIEIELFPENARETVRNFLNLAATGALDTTTFSRVVPGFIVQGGNLSTRETLAPEHAARMRRTIPDEPNLIRHERGIVSMARPDEPNMATTHFFILVGDAPHLDGTFAAFGRVTSGMDVVDTISKMPVEGDKPAKPVRLTSAALIACRIPAEP